MNMQFIGLEHKTSHDTALQGSYCLHWEVPLETECRGQPCNLPSEAGALRECSQVPAQCAQVKVAEGVCLFVRSFDNLM